MKLRRRHAVLVAVGTSLVMFGALGGAALATSPLVTRDQALEAVKHARADLDRVEAYLKQVPATPPPTTVPPVTSTSPSPPSPGQPGTDTAAARNGWGAPGWSEDFNNLSKWSLYNSDGQHGIRRPSQCVAVNGVLELRSLPNRLTCGMSYKTDDPEYGRWETRVRSEGSGWASLHIIWPNSERWPADGERDFREHTAGSRCFTGFIHYPGHTPERQYKLPENGAACVNTTLWHNVAFEVTPQAIRGWVDGNLWYEKACVADLCQMPGGGHMTIQNDDHGQASGKTATTYVDWARFYPVR